MDTRVIALLLSLTLTALAFDYTDDQEKACSFGGMKYLCENYEICSEFGLIDEAAKNALCSAYLDDLNLSGSPDPNFSFATTSEPADVESEETELPTTDYYTTENAITTREYITDIGVTTDHATEDNRFTTRYFTTEDNSATIDPAIERGPPVITIPPVNITVAPGGTGRFDCEARAAQTPQITLTRKDQLSRPNLDSFSAISSGHISQTTVNSIMINNVDEPNEGWYTCLACNRYGCAEQDAYLTVLDLCEGVTCPGEKQCVGNYDVGYGHTCECPSFCGPDELFKPDWVCSNYCEEKFNECQMKSEACRNDVLGVEVLNKGRCGKIEDPVIEEEDLAYGVIELTEGDELFLECNAVGFPQPEIVWYRDSEIVGYGNHLNQAVQFADSGEYYCEAVNCMTTKVKKVMAVVLVTIPTTPPPAPVTTPAPIETTTEPAEADNIELESPRATCAVFGDPHFLTYDLNAYTYMGMCDNVLAMDCQSARWFVYGRMRPCGKTGGSCLESVTVYMDNDILELQRGWLVNRNGKKVVPKNRKNKEIVIKGRKNDFTLLFDGSILTLTAIVDSRVKVNGDLEHDKLVIRWDGYVSVQIQTPMNTRTCGMCGNNDGRPENDMRTRRGMMTDDATAFGNSWQIDPLGRCPEPQKARSSEEVCGEKYQEVKKECERVFSISKFRGCIEAGHDPTQWVDSCVYDECEGLMQRDDLPPKCVVAQAYATQCGNDFWVKGDPFPRRNFDLENWEMEAGCPDEIERFQPILDTGCPQPTLEEERAAGADW